MVTKGWRKEIAWIAVRIEIQRVTGMKVEERSRIERKLEKRKRIKRKRVGIETKRKREGRKRIRSYCKC